MQVCAPSCLDRESFGALYQTVCYQQVASLQLCNGVVRQPCTINTLVGCMSASLEARCNLLKAARNPSFGLCWIQSAHLAMLHIV